MPSPPPAPRNRPGRRTIARKAMAIAADICVYTNEHTLEAFLRRLNRRADTTFSPREIVSSRPLHHRPADAGRRRHRACNCWRCQHDRADARRSCLGTSDDRSDPGAPDPAPPSQPPARPGSVASKFTGSFASPRCRFYHPYRSRSASHPQAPERPRRSRRRGTRARRLVAAGEPDDARASKRRGPASSTTEIEIEVRDAGGGTPVRHLGAGARTA
jgi:hypothetical protein